MTTLFDIYSTRFSDSPDNQTFMNMENVIVASDKMFYIDETAKQVYNIDLADADAATILGNRVMFQYGAIDEPTLESALSKVVG